ncbi:MAG: DNA-directed RNA polymerase subunit beta [Paenisporosarcina sp.]
MTEEVKDERKVQYISNTSKRKQHQAEKAESGAINKTWWVQIRLFPIWLRILLIIALMIGAIAAGVIIGYGYIGDGEPKDALKWETWQHILDIVKGK